MMMRRNIRLFLAMVRSSALRNVVGPIAVVLLCAAQGSAQQAMVSATIDSQQILIGDQVNLDLTVEIADNSTVAWPVFKDTITGQLEVVEVSIPDTIKKETGETVIHQRLVITTFDTGYIVVPPIQFVFNQDSAQLLATEPMLIAVSDVAVDMEAEIKPIKDPYDVPFNWRKYAKWVLLALLLLGLIIAGIYLYRRYRKVPQMPLARPVPTRPAHEIALEKLEDLRRRKLWQNDMVKEYYVELADIIREYIEHRFGILALEMTTTETIISLRLKGVEDEKLKPLQAMLKMADLVKFAKYRPLPNENEQNFETARMFINQTLIMPLDESQQQEDKE